MQIFIHPMNDNFFIYLFNYFKIILIKVE